jgi:hypothetical protein
VRSKRKVCQLIIFTLNTMTHNMSLQQFLDKHKADGLHTHTSLKGGKYFIPDEHKNQFYDLYVEEIINQEKQYLVERLEPINLGFSGDLYLTLLYDDTILLYHLIKIVGLNKQMHRH